MTKLYWIGAYRSAIERERERERERGERAVNEIYVNFSKYREYFTVVLLLRAVSELVVC